MDTSPAPTPQKHSGSDQRSGSDAPAAQVKPLPGHLYEVQLSGETTSYIVSRSFVRDHSTDSSSVADTEPSGDTHLTITNYCTCEDERMSEAILEAATPDLVASLDCPHRRTVEAFLEAGRQMAARRRQSGLTYTGMRAVVAVAPDDTGPTQITEPTLAQVEVWEGERRQPLDPLPSQQLFNHSSTGFEWGYAGSGPAQLALAMLLDFTGDPEVALSWYQEFKEQFIAGLPRDSVRAWEIDGHEIESFLRQRGWQPPTPTPLTDSETADSSDSAPFPLAEAGEELEFAGYYGSTGRCRVYFRRYQGQSVALVSDLPNSGGTSVTNRIEVVAAMVCLRFRVAPERLVLIQYHPPSSISGESFMLLSFQHRNELLYPQWTHLRRRDATFLWGRTLPF